MGFNPFENYSSGGEGFTPTDAQLDAMNSGITSEDVEQISTNKNNISKLIYERKNLQLGTSTSTPQKTPLTWTRSGEGLYYSEEITLSSINTILGWCVVTFTALKETDIILVAQNDTGMGKFRLLASTDTYSTNASIDIRIYGTTDTV